MGERLLLLFLLTTATGCAPIPPPPPLESIAFSPDLAIDLREMIALPSGLHYREVDPGTGAAAAQGDRVAVRYIGWLPDGTIIDENIADEEPARFRLGGGSTIRGWDEGITGMAAGGQRMLVIPSQLAYGRWGQGRVPPNTPLVFLVQLLTID